MKRSNQVASDITIVSRPFSPSDLVGGHPALNLVNTVTARNTALPGTIDWLNHREAASGIGEAGKSVSEEKVLRLLSKQAAGSPAGAVRALGRLKQLREALYGRNWATDVWKKSTGCNAWSA